MWTKLIWSIVFFVIAKSVLPQEIKPCKKHFLCTNDVCESSNLGGCGPRECPLDDEKCSEGRLLTLYQVEDDFCNCCPQTCLTYLKEGEECTRNLLAKFPTNMCGPMLECQKTTKNEFRCQRMSPIVSLCLELLTDYEERDIREEVGIFESPPKCTEDGEFSPVQCFGTGLCHCVDKDTGEPIFGFEGSKAEALTSNMNCLCARQHREILKMDCRMSIEYFGGSTTKYEKAYEQCLQSGQMRFFKFGGSKCLPNGNPDDIQCIHVTETKEEDTCLCLNEGSFNPLEETQPMSKVSQLSCHREDYLGPCGRIIRERMDEENDTSQVWYGGEKEPLCSPDGYFDAIQVSQSHGSTHFCSDRNGEQIEDFEASSDKESMHCRCALARKYLDPRLGVPNCCKNGNYECRQCQKGYCYCVDQNGRQVGLEVNQIDIDTLNCENCCPKIN